MARISSLPDSSCIFAGNPIVYTVVPATITGKNISFHRVEMRVVLHGHEYPLSQPVDVGTTEVEFDISGCFLSAAELYEYTPVTIPETPLPVMTTTSIKVKDVWVEDGVVKEGHAATVENRTAVMGAFSDYERLLQVVTPSLSRKPSAGELVLAGDDIVYPTGTALAPVSSIYKVPSAAKGAIDVGGRSAYVVDDQQTVLFQFVNSRGGIETIRARRASSEKVKSEKKAIDFARFERFNKFSRVRYDKHQKPTEFSMSSGFVNYDWAQWWACEFCQSEHCWMSYNGLWIPCNVTIDDSTTVIDRTKSSLLSVEFTVAADLNGALW